MGEQHGALALAQVVTGGFAGLLRVAEDPEQVVTPLEGPAEVEPVARQRLHARVVQATRLTTRQRELLEQLGFPTPAQILSRRLPRAP